MGAVSEDGNPFGDFYTMLRKQIGKMKRELAAGDACVVLARIDAIDSMVEVIQGDDWANEKREAEFVVEVVKVLLLGDSHLHLVGAGNRCFNPDTKGGQGTAKGRGFAVFYITRFVDHGTGAVFQCAAQISSTVRSA